MADRPRMAFFKFEWPGLSSVELLGDGTMLVDDKECHTHAFGSALREMAHKWLEGQEEVLKEAERKKAVEGELTLCWSPTRVIGLHVQGPIGPIGMRTSWLEYFIDVLHAVAKRGSCTRGSSGAVIVKDNQILSTGYVGAARGLPHCVDAGCLMRTVIYHDEPGEPAHKHCHRTAHAEENAIVQAAKHGHAIDGATMICSMEPCLRCAGMIINAGITEVVAERAYHGAALSRQWLKQANVVLTVLNDQPADYDKTGKG